MVDDQFWNVNSISELTYQNWPSTDPWIPSTGQPMTVFGLGAPFLGPPRKEGFVLCVFALFLCPSFALSGVLPICSNMWYLYHTLLQIGGSVGDQEYFCDFVTKSIPNADSGMYACIPECLCSDPSGWSPPKSAILVPVGLPDSDGARTPLLYPQAG